MALFFYGTLLDDDVRRLVLGPERTDALRMRPARLYGFCRVRASVGDFPILKPRPGMAVDGMLVTDAAAEAGRASRAIDRKALQRIAHFEGDEYLLNRRTVWLSGGRKAVAWVFLPTHGRYLSGDAWTLERWQRRSKHRLMPYFARLMQQPTIATIGVADVPWRLRRRTRQVAETLTGEQAIAQEPGTQEPGTQEPGTQEPGPVTQSKKAAE
jgi:hypothetical protein